MAHRNGGIYHRNHSDSVNTVIQPLLVEQGFGSTTILTRIKLLLQP